MSLVCFRVGVFSGGKGVERETWLFEGGLFGGGETEGGGVNSSWLVFQTNVSIVYWSVVFLSAGFAFLKFP